MYSPAVVEDRLARLLASPVGAAYPSGVERIPAPQCHDMTRRLSTAWDPRNLKQPLRRPLTNDEQAFIHNERLLAKLDYRYCAERYHAIIRPDRGISPLYPLWESQELILQALAREEEARWRTSYPDGLVFNLLKARQLGACLDPSARVLTADLRWVALDDLAVGTELVALDEQGAGGKGGTRRMRTAVVEAKQDVVEPVYEIRFDDGQVIRVTGDHRFLYKLWSQPMANWRTVRTMRVGDGIRAVAVPWNEPTLDDAWFGGLLDGEGCLHAERKQASGAEVNVSQVAGLVWDRAEHYLRERGVTYRIEIDPGERSSKHGSRPVNKLCVSRMDEIFRLLGLTRPVRFLGRRWWEGKELPGKRVGGGWRTIVAITKLGPARMIDLQTSTKTFIVEGLVSHNSTLCQSIIAHRATTQSYTRCMVASDVPENSGSSGLFGMLELTVLHTPWWLKSAERFHTKNHHIVWANHSSVVVEAGKSMKGGLQDKGGQKGQLGRSKTYTMVHLSELSTWENPETIDDALDPAVARTPRTFWVRESTAKGRNNWWHTEWKLSERGISRAFNVFIPWYAEIEKYWLPPPEGWIPRPTTTEFLQRAQTHGPRWMGREVRLTREQAYWYERNRQAAEERGSLYKFLEEYPSEPEESFQYSGHSIFSPAQIDYLRTRAKPARAIYLVQPNTLIAEIRDALMGEADTAAALQDLGQPESRP